MWNEVDSTKEKGGKEGCSSAFMSKVWLRKAGNSPDDDCPQDYRASPQERIDVIGKEKQKLRTLPTVKIKEQRKEKARKSRKDGYRLGVVR